MIQGPCGSIQNYQKINNYNKLEEIFFRFTVTVNFTVRAYFLVIIVLKVRFMRGLTTFVVGGKRWSH